MGGERGCYVKTRVCTEHTEAAGTLKVKINNSYLKLPLEKEILEKMCLLKNISHFHPITKRRGSESWTVYKTTDKSIKN